MDILTLTMIILIGTLLLVFGSIIIINPRVFFFGIHEKETVKMAPKEESIYEITSITESFTEIN